MKLSRREKKHSALWRRVILIICGLMLGVNVYLFNANQLVGNSMPMPFGVGMAVVLSGSMEPAMSVGDLIIVRETDDFQVGDAIVFESAGEMIVHRIVMMNENMIVTQGDANNVPDEPIDYEAVKGKVLVCIPWIGHVAQFFKTPVGIILLLAAAFGLVELSYRQERSRDDDELEEIKAEIRKLRKEQEEAEVNRETKFENR